MAYRLNKRERELFDLLKREGVDVELSLSRGVALVRYSMKTTKDYLVTRLGDQDRRILQKFARRGWLQHHSDIDAGILLGLTSSAAKEVVMGEQTTQHENPKEDE